MKTNSPKKLDNYNIQAAKKHNPFNAELQYEFFYNFESEHTRKSYRIDIGQFFAFLCDHFIEINDYTSIQKFHFVAFRNWLTDSNLAPKSINRKMAANSSFFDFLVEKGIVAFNPVTCIKRPRQEVRTPTNDASDVQIKKRFS